MNAESQGAPQQRVARPKKAAFLGMLLVFGRGGTLVRPAASLMDGVGAGPPWSCRGTIPLVHEGGRSPPDADGEAGHSAQYHHFAISS